MAIISNSQTPNFMAPSLISQQLQVVDDAAWLWALHFHDVSEEEPIYLYAQNGTSPGDVIQERQRRQWGIDFIPSFHPSSSALAPMMEQSWLSPSPAAFSVPSPACYPTPESLFCDDSPRHNLLDVLPDGRFRSNEEYLDSAIEVPPDRDNCPPKRKTSLPFNFLLAGQARAGATGPISSAIESVEAPSMNGNSFDQPSSVERQKKGAAFAGVAPSRSSSPSIVPTPIPSWRGNDPRTTLPSPATSAPSPTTSSTTRSPSPPSFAAMRNTPSSVPSQRQKRRRNDEDVTATQPEKERRLEMKNTKRKREKSNEFRQHEISGWAVEDGKTFTKDKFRNTFGPSRK